MATKVSHLPDGTARLEKCLARFWEQNEVEFPWSFNLVLHSWGVVQKRIQDAPQRRAWMTERHGEAANSLRAATREALARVGR